HLGDALQKFLPRQQVQAAELIVWAELAPIRARRPVLPTRIASHFFASLDLMAVSSRRWRRILGPSEGQPQEQGAQRRRKCDAPLAPPVCHDAYRGRWERLGGRPSGNHAAGRSMKGGSASFDVLVEIERGELPLILVCRRIGLVAQLGDPG